ncbi:chemotaxis protein CheW [Vibrio tarriae]|uniref:Chemotaxis protein CheW n=1 Tax=Vibrio tarriae TaxID=2014742 RepID=A0AAU8WSP3_9VIBR|nr:chemotaxis protein CheW [Vibrio tarriae]ASK54860.1 chemotaxis protein CheW [Vibrio tarriae]RBM51390.1 chemotaxis protein CheW [Vibrio tarriae]
MSSALISSEQALNDYFTALLDEEAVEFEPAPTKPDPVWELAPAVQSVPNKSYFDTEVEELELPNLEDVQRLLSQLESSNPVADLDLEHILEENTAKIAKIDPVVQPCSVVEEIQEWEIETSYVEPDIETTESVIEDDLEPEYVDAESESEIAIETSVEEPVAETQATPETQAGRNKLGTWTNTIREKDFQVLYFDVNGVTFAVPLDELGGIHRMTTLNHLIGRPAWYLGLQTNRDSQLDVVDTAKWVMAEKLHDESYKQAYQYIVMLDESAWGLASTQLMGTELLSTEKVRWREQVGKRPWLAGMVKEKMCALIHVQALIAMLNAGLDVKALEN